MIRQLKEHVAAMDADAEASGIASVLMEGLTVKLPSTAEKAEPVQAHGDP